VTQDTKSYPKITSLHLVTGHVKGCFEGLAESDAAVEPLNGEMIDKKNKKTGPIRDSDRSLGM